MCMSPTRSKGAKSSRGGVEFLSLWLRGIFSVCAFALPMGSLGVGRIFQVVQKPKFDLPFSDLAFISSLPQEYLPQALRGNEELPPPHTPLWSLLSEIELPGPPSPLNLFWYSRGKLMNTRRYSTLLQSRSRWPFWLKVYEKTSLSSIPHLEVRTLFLFFDCNGLAFSGFDKSWK